MAAVTDVNEVNGFDSFDPLSASVGDLQALLQSGRVKSSDLVQNYLRQIKRHNDYLKAVVVTTPESVLSDITRRSDEERAAGKVRSSLHGIPVLIKDNILTGPELGMDTTAGSLALVGARKSWNAPLVNNLIDAGAIVLGKTSLSELAFFKGIGLSCGWSAISGQGQSAYVRGGVDPNDTFAGHSNPGGSSSGSAISVSAGFAPLAIGTETDGSIVMPSNRASIFCIKPTVGLLSAKGIVPVCKDFDTAGPQAKTPKDVGVLLDGLTGKFSLSPGPYETASQNRSWEGLRIGVLDPETWRQPPTMIKPVQSATDQMTRDIKNAYATIEPLVAGFHRNIDIYPIPDVLKMSGGAFQVIFSSSMAKEMDEWLSSYDECAVRSIKELIDFNEKHSDQELPADNPNQDYLIKTLNAKVSKEEYDETLNGIRRIGRDDGIDKALAAYKIDVILGPADSPITKMASASGYPIATLPLGYLDFNGRPFGLVALTSAYQEDLLLKVMGAWEETFPNRVPPPMLQQQVRSESGGTKLS